MNTIVTSYTSGINDYIRCCYTFVVCNQIEFRIIHMTNLLITDTTELELESIVELENSNAIYIIPNSRDEHLNLISDKGTSHLTLKSDKQTFLGFVILAGLENQSNNIEFRTKVVLK